MRRDELLLKIKHEASLFEHPSPIDYVRADDLLRYDGQRFIDTLYRKILKREPDAAGKEHYLELAKRLPKPLIVHYFSSSDEARQKGTEIAGLISAAMKFYLKNSSSATRKSFLRMYSFLSFRKAVESRVDYSRFYLDFEERFRGSQEEVEQGLRVYLSLLQGADDSIVDLGSGRGEWLRLLKKEGLNAKGVEINPYFTEECEKDGLEVIENDVFKFLENVANSTIGAISAFHLIEHLDPRQRLLFLEEACRVLRTDGLLILETPNPRNILVSAGDFWRDPEHTTPVFPDTLSFMAKFVGFSDARCYFFDKDRTALIPSANTEFRDLQDYIDVSRDFALVARKS